MWSMTTSSVHLLIYYVVHAASVVLVFTPPRRSVVADSTPTFIARMANQKFVETRTTELAKCRENEHPGTFLGDTEGLANLIVRHGTMTTDAEPVNQREFLPFSECLKGKIDEVICAWTNYKLSTAHVDFSLIRG